MPLPFGGHHCSVRGLAAITLAILMSIWRACEAKDVRSFGSARCAKQQEIVEADILGNGGMVLRKLDRALSTGSVTRLHR